MSSSCSFVQPLLGLGGRGGGAGAPSIFVEFAGDGDLDGGEDILLEVGRIPHVLPSRIRPVYNECPILDVYRSYTNLCFYRLNKRIVIYMVETYRIPKYLTVPHKVLF